jgi:methylenetetrahydrofolate reductase (NADPH)
VQHIRSNHGDLFHITVAGYPEGHPNTMSLVTEGYDSLTESEKGRCSFETDEEGNEKVFVCKDADFQVEMDYLKSKIAAGADCIITQMFFDCTVFDTFVAACRAQGITVPIIPGIMCVSNFGGFKRMTTTCKTRVPKELMARAEAKKAADEDEGKGETFKRFGIELGIEMTKHLIASQTVGLHYYTLNSSVATLEILSACGRDRKQKD